MIFKQCLNAHADHTNLRVGLLYHHQVIWDVDVQEKAIPEHVTAWREANAIILVKTNSASSVRRVLFGNLLQKTRSNSARMRSVVNRAGVMNGK